MGTSKQCDKYTVSVQCTMAIGCGATSTMYGDYGKYQKKVNI